MEASNVKAMREALESIYMDAQFICDYADEPGVVRNRSNRIERTVNSALSASSRNCDEMPDIDKLTMNDLAKSPCKSTIECASREELLALVRWLLATATERKGESDGK